MTELGNKQATTAFGALVDVPGNVDLLVAGTSCVDFSALNVKNKKIEDNGKSGQTWRGMLSWVKNHKPPILILENVHGGASKVEQRQTDAAAPWEKMKENIEECGYAADFVAFDTKAYYIPHTRMRRCVRVVMRAA